MFGLKAVPFKSLSFSAASQGRPLIQSPVLLQMLKPFWSEGFGYQLLNRLRKLS